jgi:hypothetical protein
MGIIIHMWRQGELIENATVFPIFALLFYVFSSTNTQAIYGLVNILGLFAILRRLNSIMILEEKQSINQGYVSKEEVCVNFKDASFQWGF